VLIILSIATISLFSTSLSAAVTKVRDMAFGDQVVGVPKVVVVGPTEAGAAVFNATGLIPGRTVTCSILTKPVNITNGGSGSQNTIQISAFIISGCTAVVPPGGTINNIGVGATATIQANDNQGAYSGSDTFRLVTN